MLKVKKIIGFVFILLVFNSILKAQSTNEISVYNLEIALKQISNNIILLDVRTENEFHEGHIKGAINYNYLEESFKQKTALLDKSKTYYVYCFSGGRSSQAITDMQSMGFSNVFDVKGGIRAWTQASFDIVNE